MTLKWILKQLLPLKYKSVYNDNGVEYTTTFRMWFGKVLNIKNK